MSNDTELRVKAAVAEQLGMNVEEINNDASFMEDLGADSLDLVELVMSFESDFGITIYCSDNTRIQSRSVTRANTGFFDLAKIVQCDGGWPSPGQRFPACALPDRVSFGDWCSRSNCWQYQ